MLTTCRNISILLLLTLCVAFHPAAQANNEWLTVDIKGTKKRLKSNIFAHLGALPDSDVQRRAFLFSVEDNIQAALESMGRYHGVVDIDVKEHDTGPWELAINITPGDVTTVQWIDIKMSGEMLVDRVFTGWLDNLSIKPGDPLNHGIYTDIKNQLAALALARGYFDGQFIRSEINVNRDVNLAQIYLHFESSKRYRFGDVTFEGHTLDDDIMDALVPFESESPYATQVLTDLNQNLLETSYFGNIKVLPQVNQVKDGVVPIKVEVSPRASHAFEVGVGADFGNNSDNSVDPRIRLTWRTPQINSHGHKQETTAEWSPDRPKILTTYTIPLTHPLNDQLKIKAGILRDKYGVTQEYDEEADEFNSTGQLESKKYLLGLLRQRRLENNWLFNYSLEGIREFYTQSDIEYDPAFYLAGIGATRINRSDTSLDPKSGNRQIYSLDYADPNVGSAARLMRIQAKFKWIETFFDKHRFVARVDLGANFASTQDSASIAPSLRYFAGGDQSIRGYGYQELGPFIEYTNTDDVLSRQVVGGRYLAVGSIEYQYYVTPKWRVASFVDAGNAFEKDQFEPVVSVGGGLHWISPIGPIKVDIGVGINETETIERSWRIHLTMGTDL